MNNIRNISIQKVVHLIFLSLLLTSSVFAESIEISNILPPVRDQGSSGFCYAYAAADLMSAHLGLAQNQRVSAISLSMSASIFDHTVHTALTTPIGKIFQKAYPHQLLYQPFNDRNYNPDFSSRGNYAAWTVFSAMSAEHVCLETGFPFSDNSSKEFTRQFQYKILDEVNPGRPLTIPSFYQKNQPSQLHREWIELAMATARERYKCSHSIPIKAANLESFVYRPSEITNHSTSNSAEDRKAEALRRQSEVKQQLRETIASNLRKNIPMVVSFNVEGLWRNNESGQHDSVIAGLDSGEGRVTRILIRNHYGERCTTIYNIGAHCPGGYEWIPADELFNAMNALFWLNPTLQQNF